MAIMDATPVPYSVEVMGSAIIRSETLDLGKNGVLRCMNQAGGCRDQ